MSLKIVGRGPRMSFQQSTASPMMAKGARLKCEACDKTISVMFPSNCTAIMRQQLIRNAADEHRRVVCTVGVVEDGRKFDIWYPRQN
jgi:hypothetical protein